MVIENHLATFFFNGFLHFNTTFLSYRLIKYISYFCSYKSREEFCVDVRQIFDNCEMFNEDDSPVGKAGHGMRKFFEVRWAELTDKHS